MTTTTTARGLSSRAAIETAVREALASTPIIDMHTHLYPPSFGTPVLSSRGDRDPHGLMLWGIDELLTYHYLIAELFRVVSVNELTYEQFWAMSKTAQADLIWQKLFIERSPISEACRGVVTTLHALGLDPNDRNLNAYRTWFAEQDPSEQIDRAMKLANVKSITMTNNVFDDNERNRWLKNPRVGSDPRFTAVLRFDPLICDWKSAAGKLREWGYQVHADNAPGSVGEVKRFLREWLEKTNSIYAAVSLPPAWRYGSHGHCAEAWKDGNAILTGAVLPVVAERNIPFAMMIGAQRGVNPPLRDAADMGFAADVMSVCHLCREFPRNKFFVTMLSLQNQHELAVAARKFGNLMVFGCWWHLNNPSLIEQLTRFRTELLGISYIPQHSDCRVLEQLIYKWDHSRKVIAKVLTDKYADIAETGWHPTAEDIRRDVKKYVSDNFTEFLSR
jgi:hypothetical protein